MASQLKITVICDNRKYDRQLEIAWGFACLIQGLEKTILFDTGPDHRLLVNNMAKLAIDANTIDTVFLSHLHRDHTGGLDSFLQKNSDVEVYVPQSFPKRLKDEPRAYGAKVVEVTEPLNICEDAYSTGQVGKFIKEQSLVIRTDEGLVIVAGCAHAGIIKVAKVAGVLHTVNGLLTGKILLAMGGFHLEWATKSAIRKIISALERSGVGFVAPCHCTGEKALGLFKEHFGNNCLSIGAGKTVSLDDLRQSADS